MILNKYWNFENKLSALTDVICQRASISQNAVSHGICAKVLKRWIKEIYQDDVHHLNHTEQIIIKDSNQIYHDFNKAAVLLGSKNASTIGKSDFDISPEFAEQYTQIDRETIKTKSKAISIVPVYHQYFGWVDYKGQAYPIMDDDGDVCSTVVVCQMQNGFNDLPFNSVLKTISNGGAQYFVKSKSYESIVNGILNTFTGREAELLIYLLIRMPVKRIAKHMRVSFKTIEKMITILNAKVGVSSSESLVDSLEMSGFYKNL